MKNIQKKKKSDNKSLDNNILEDRNKQLEESLKRSLADMDNLKKRTLEDIKRENKNFVTKIVPLFDDVLKLEDFSKDAGVKAVCSKLLADLKTNLKLEKLGKQGDNFDANKMEVISIDNNFKKDKVSQIINYGWTLDGDVIVNARVIVGGK